MKIITKQELLKLIDRDNPVILDVGAYDGTDSYEFAELGCTVYCFEPIHANRMKMRLHKNIFIHPYAIGAVETITEFKYCSTHQQSGSLLEPKNHLTIWPDIKFDTTEVVKVQPLDHWFAMFGRDIDLIWVDVNGSEGDLVRGATETFKNTRFLFIESSDKELFEGQIKTDELLAMLPGWELLGVYNSLGNFGNLLLKNGKV